jgi:anthranilate phosphoribosyltransferase
MTPNDVVSRAIDAVCAGDHLTADHAAAVLTEIMEGRVGEVQTGAFLIALRAKGETVPELVGLARTMRSLAAPVSTARTDLVDTAGTGGGPTTFNVSTTAALVAAGAGCAVAKHGNRSTSPCGSAELLEALGVDIELSPEQVGRCIDELGFGFMFAPRHHAAMAHVVPARKALGVRTIFNFLGPLTNPAGAERQLLGVADRRYQETIAEALLGLGSAKALVVSAEDGVDELSTTARTRVIEVAEGRTEEWFVEPGDFGLGPAELDQVAGGSPAENAVATRAVLEGEAGPRRDLVLLNAGAAIYVGGRADSLGAGVEQARTAVDSGAARELLSRLVKATLAMGADEAAAPSG